MMYTQSLWRIYCDTFTVYAFKVMHLLYTNLLWRVYCKCIYGDAFTVYAFMVTHLLHAHWMWLGAQHLSWVAEDESHLHDFRLWGFTFESRCHNLKLTTWQKESFPNKNLRLDPHFSVVGILWYLSFPASVWACCSQFSKLGAFSSDSAVQSVQSA